MSFIQGMQGWCSIQKSVSIIQYINGIKDKNRNHLDRYRKKTDKNSTPLYLKKKKKTVRKLEIGTFST